MIYALYIVAFNLGLLAYVIARLINRKSPIHQPLRPATMRFSSSLAGVCVLVLTAYGFWKLPWYLPIVAYCTAFFTAGTIGYRASRSDKAPGFVIGMAAISTLLTLLFLQLMN